MATIFPAGPSTGILLPILVAGDIFAVAYYRRHARWPDVWRCLPSAAVGICCGWAFYFLWYQPSGSPLQAGRWLTDNHIKRIIGIIVIAVIILGACLEKNGHNAAVPRRHWFAVLIGLLGGFATMVANAAGPIWTVYFLALRLSKEAFLGSNAWVFLILNVFKLPWSHSCGFITADSLWFNLKMLPGVVIGALLGNKAVRHVPQKAFDIAVRGLAVLAAFNLILGEEISRFWR